MDFKEYTIRNLSKIFPLDQIPESKKKKNQN